MHLTTFQEPSLVESTGSGASRPAGTPEVMGQVSSVADGHMDPVSTLKQYQQ